MTGLPGGKQPDWERLVYLRARIRVLTWLTAETTYLRNLWAVWTGLFDWFVPGYNWDPVWLDERARALEWLYAETMYEWLLLEEVVLLCEHWPVRLIQADPTPNVVFTPGPDKFDELMKEYGL
jgi:hypothetical protein